MNCARCGRERMEESAVELHDRGGTWLCSLCLWQNPQYIEELMLEEAKELAL